MCIHFVGTAQAVPCGQMEAWCVCVFEGMDVTKRWEGRVAKGWLSDDKHGQGKEWY